MSKSGMAAMQTTLLLVAMFANAASKSSVRIKVLNSETRTVVLDDSGIPRNCDQLNYDAYCHSGKTEQETNTLLVQEGDGTPYRVACTIEAKWSRCIPLPKGETFDARKEKHGITVYYQDDEGKPRKQLYTFEAQEAKAKPGGPATAVAAQQAMTTPQKAASAPAQIPVPAPVAETATSSVRETVKCSFSSTPPGAEVTLDGRYVGSTPSVLGLTTGPHVVVISMPGFAQWKRELAVVPGSELTVNAVLQKVQ